MNYPYSTFRKFQDKESAEEIACLLSQKKIQFLLENNSAILDPLIIGTSSDPNYLIKLRPYDFESAYKALEEGYSSELNKVDSDYYLLQFTDDELEEIILKPEEWGFFDYLLAQKLLRNRGKHLDQSKIKEIREERAKELSKPTSEKGIQIVIGYVFAFLFPPISIILGGFGAILKKLYRMEDRHISTVILYKFMEEESLL